MSSTSIPDDDELPEYLHDVPKTEDEMDPCSAMMGHRLTPINDEKGGPITRMVCDLCNESRLVQPGDLDRYSGEYPDWIDIDSADDSNETAE